MTKLPCLPSSQIRKRLRVVLDRRRQTVSLTDDLAHSPIPKSEARLADKSPVPNYAAMMNSPDDIPEKETIQVPRDLKPDDDARSETFPPSGERTRDEDSARDQKGLLEGSAIGEALHRHPPQGEGQLTTGSGGDAARPGKEGIFGKPIPPRGKMS